MKHQIYKRLQSKWDDEQTALQDVCNDNGLTADLLTAQHTDTEFVWKSKAIKMKKEIIENEIDALIIAKKHFDTFEGNLKTHHTDTAWVYSKIKG